MKIDNENKCYVLLKTNKIHPITYQRFDLVWYPEDRMTLFDTIQYQPYVRSIVTENPWLISMYKMENVKIWSIEDKKWKTQHRQTYGASVNMIMMTILGITQTIPSGALDGGIEIQEYIKKIETSY